MKQKRQSIQEHKFEYRAGWTDSHHLQPRSRRGQSIGSNLLKLDGYKHSAWHLLFGNLTLHEIIELLQRLERIKNSQKRRFKL